MKVKRIICLALVLAIAFSFTACKPTVSSFCGTYTIVEKLYTVRTEILSNRTVDSSGSKLVAEKDRLSRWGASKVTDNPSWREDEPDWVDEDLQYTVQEVTEEMRTNDIVSQGVALSGGLMSHRVLDEIKGKSYAVLMSRLPTPDNWSTGEGIVFYYVNKEWYVVLGQTMYRLEKE